MSGSESLSRQVRRQPNTCIFCGGHASRRGEHLFSRWMGKQINHGKDNNHTSSKIRTKHTPGAVVIAPKMPVLRGGPTHTMTVPFVCSPCNNGWMSRVDSAMIPIFERLRTLERYQISMEDVLTISNWIMLKTMVGEWDDPETAGIGQRARTEFMQERKIPLVTRIWLGRTDGKNWQTRYRHHGIAAYSPSMALMALMGTPLPYNSQSTTLAVNGIIFHCRTSVLSTLDLSIKDRKSLKKLVAINPPDHTSHWPPAILSERETSDLADELSRRLMRG